MRGTKKKNQRRNTTIRGVVALSEWSDSRDDAEVVILTDSEEEFCIDASETSIRPSKFINSRVEATGKIYEYEDQLVLAVKRIRVIDSIHDFDDYGDTDEDIDTYDDGFDDSVGMSSWADDDDVSSYARLIRGNGF